MPSATDNHPFGAVVALKALGRAKTRIGGDPRLRERLAMAMLLDTVGALQRVAERIVVVGVGLAPVTAEVPVEVVEDPGQDLNAALIVGADRLLRQGSGNVLACVADLPALRPSSVAAFVGAAPDRSRTFLRDAAGTGSTMLFGRALRTGNDLQPGFEGASALRHLRSGALDPGGAWPDARLDVDTIADLRRAAELGLGPATRPLLEMITGTG
ncbi:2-phospho-L-lactate guanylyltransferase [Naumannella huperziae]